MWIVGACIVVNNMRKKQYVIITKICLRNQNLFRQQHHIIQQLCNDIIMYVIYVTTRKHSIQMTVVHTVGETYQPSSHPKYTCHYNSGYLMYYMRISWTLRAYKDYFVYLVFKRFMHRYTYYIELCNNVLSAKCITEWTCWFHETYAQYNVENTF